MDALSSPASTLTAGGPFLSATSLEPLLLRTTTNPTTHIPPYPHRSTKPSSSFTSRPPSSTFTTTYLSPPPPVPRQKPTTTTTYRRASTGYAAALLDVSRCNSTTTAVERDAGRLLRAVRGDQGRGEVVTRVVEEGGFYREVVVLVRMQVRKGKVGLVGEVMEEFGRLCDEVNGTTVVVVSSEEWMEEGELKRIAHKVKRMSGAMKVKVSHVVCHGSSLMFAV